MGYVEMSFWRGGCPPAPKKNIRLGGDQKCLGLDANRGIGPNFSKVARTTRESSIIKRKERRKSAKSHTLLGCHAGTGCFHGLFHSGI